MACSYFVDSKQRKNHRAKCSPDTTTKVMEYSENEKSPWKSPFSTMLSLFLHPQHLLELAFSKDFQQGPSPYSPVQMEDQS